MSRCISGGMLCLILVAGLSSLQAQRRPYFPFFQQEHFFGPVPSPRTESMGRSEVAVGGTVTTSWHNPAGIGTIADWELDLSTAAPFYALRESDYYYAGVAKRLHPKLVTALSLNRLAIGPTSFTLNVDGQNYPVNEPYVNDLVATVAAELLPGLHLGVNAHLFTFKAFDEVAAARSFYVDAGALYALKLSGGGEVRVGASVVNLNYAELLLESPAGTSSSNVFPVIGRAGIAYEQGFDIEVPGAGTQSLRVLLSSEYQDLFNSPIRSAFRLGGEAVLADLLALRLGFFTQSEDDFGFANNRDRINAFTYGFGLKVPVDRLSGGKFPVSAHLDYYAMPSPAVIFSGSRLPNKRGFGLRVVALLPSQS